jgi:hypothetical protein
MPIKKMRVKPTGVLYMTLEWKKAIRVKRRAARKYSMEGNRENREARHQTEKKSYKGILEAAIKQIKEQAW